MYYPTQPHDQNKIKIEWDFFFNKKEISERILMKIVLSSKSIASLYSNSAFDTNITRPNNSLVTSIILQKKEESWRLCDNRKLYFNIIILDRQASAKSRQGMLYRP